MGKGRKEIKLGLSRAYDIFWAFDRHTLVVSCGRMVII